jgi:hypothetical protein
VEENTSKTDSVSDIVSTMSAPQLGTLAFNLSAISWIGLNISFRGLAPYYMPCSYMHPNLLNIICGAILLFSTYLATLSVKRGSLLPAFITFTFLFSLLATVIRYFSS